MGLSVNERGAAIATFRWIEVRLMETLAAWVPSTPEMEAKLTLGAHIWDSAQHADALGKRTRELRLPEQHSQEPAAEYVELLDDVATVQETPRRIAALYDVVLPGLERRFNAYLDAVDHLLDAPSVRVLERISADMTRMLAEGRELQQELPPPSTDDEAWVVGIRRRDETLGDVVTRRPAKADAGAV